MKPSAIFLSNELFFDASKKEGGVRVCTEEYLALMSQLYDVEVFKVRYHISYVYRARVKLGLNAYNDYKAEQYAQQLKETILKRNVKVVFLNLSNTAPFAKVIKTAFGNDVKVILCSHGNESGDFLHEATRFKRRVPFFRNWFSEYTLGHLLKKEAEFRQNDLDAVLTVSPIEEALEFWLGAKFVFMVPRTVNPEFLDRKPVKGRVGFFGDLSHSPNFYGVDEVCKAIAKLSSYPQGAINLRLVGAPAKVGERLAQTYSFVTYLGYLNNDSLKAEVETWAYFLNPVFYYSRGVSTKMAKAFGWGLPVITTTIGCRGYVWSKGDPVIADSAPAMAIAIQQLSTDIDSFREVDEQVRELVASVPNLEAVAKQLEIFIRQFL